MRNHTYVLAILAAALLAPIPAAAQAATVRVWEHENFGGASRVIDRAVSNLDGGWNDRISSLRVESGQWEICRDADFRNCRTIGVDTPEMASLGFGWNDAISSLRPIGTAAAASSPEAVAQGLYRALLGRDAEPEGLRNAAAMVADGKLRDLVRSLTRSSEYRSATAGRSASEILDQIHRGLLDRPADATARNRYLDDVEDGDVAEVVLDLLASNEFASRVGGGTAVRRDQSVGSGIEVQARGDGTVIWGHRGTPEDINAAKIHLGDNGRYTMTFSGNRQHKLDGTWRREADGTLRLLTADLPTKPTIQVDGRVLLENNQLARVDVWSGTQGQGDRMVYTFVADGYDLPREQAACEAAIRSRLGDRDLAFLTSQRSHTGSNRYDLRGEVLILSENESVRYRCEVDARGERVLQASVDQR